MDMWRSAYGRKATTASMVLALQRMMQDTPRVFTQDVIDRIILFE
jgi:hypothetical protein